MDDRDEPAKCLLDCVARMTGWLRYKCKFSEFAVEAARGWVLEKAVSFLDNPDEAPEFMNAWIYRTGINAANSAARREQRIAFCDPALLLDEPERLQEPMDRPFLTKVLSDLSDDERAIFHVVFELGLSMEKAARELHSPVARVRTRKLNLIIKLRSKLKDL